MDIAPSLERNVTTRPLQEEALALRHLDALLTSAPFGFVFLDRELRFVRISQRLADMNGYSVAAHIGRTVAEMVPNLEATLLEVTAQIMATGQPVLDHAFTGETAHAAGVIRTWNESWYPVRDEQAEIIGFSGLVVDITERAQAEAALRLQNDRFELAVKASQAVLWQQDTDLRFTWLHNPAPGIDGSDAVGKREADLLERAEDVAVIEGLKREVIRSGVGMRTEFIPHVQGTAHCFELLMEPLRDATGRITGLTGAAIDITERKKNEQAFVEATAAAEKANRAKTDFLSCMSHELRTPLSSILGFAQLIKDGSPAPTATQKKNVEHILKGGWYLLELINEPLDLAQIESGKLTLNQEAVPLTEIMRECQDLMEHQAHERGISLLFPSLMLPRVVWADRTRLKQVLLNLLSNAIKYNGVQGSVTVELTLRPQDAVRVSVRDTGDGLSAEQLAQLFQPFNRLGMEEGSIQGTGIGLITSKRLVELMGGTIGAQSVVGVGSVFWFELKWAAPEQL